LELATGSGNLSDRLYEAAYCILRIQPDEIPDELRHVLMGVKDDLHFAQPKWTKVDWSTRLRSPVMRTPRRSPIASSNYTVSFGSA
jgi:hypothetical protein